jgi:hypothetical protein
MLPLVEPMRFTPLPLLLGARFTRGVGRVMQTWPHDQTTSFTPEVITLPGVTASICDGLNEGALSQ